jgi:hypothetical protein
MAREAWTDDLKERMDQRFDEVDGRMSEGFTRVVADIREIRRTLDSVQRTMVQGFVAMSGVMVTGFLTLAGLQIF